MRELVERPQAQMKSKSKDRNKSKSKAKSEGRASPTGWWIASYIERAVWDGESRASAASRCIAWENTILLKARDRDSAYRKAIRLGSSNTSKFSDATGKRTGKWVFEGLTSLLPVYEELGDGAEILWRDHSGRSLKKVRSMVKNKAALEAYADD